MNASPGFDTLSRAFFDANAARELLESIRWQSGPICPHCGVDGRAYKLEPKKKSSRPVRPGVYKCADCRKQFTVTVGTIFESTRVPLNKWIYLIQLMTVAKKGVSAHQVHRTLGVTYKTAWFMCHRIRKAMEEEPLAGMLGGGGGTVEADETYVGGKQRGIKGQAGPTSGANKSIVFTLVERGGRARSQVVPDVTADTLKEAIRDEVDSDSRIMSDGLNSYKGIGSEFTGGHGIIDHMHEYVRGEVHTQTVECYFSLFKRGIMGAFHHVSRKHLHRYLSEFDFRWDRRKQPDGQRLVELIQSVAGKRLYYKASKGLTASCDAT